METKVGINDGTLTKEEILNDYRIAFESRQASLLGRKEVFMGKARFGIFGDGKEVAQVAMAKYFKNGDFRSGYYRDQTFMLAIGELTLEAYFAQLYAHADLAHEPSSGGRLMNSHFSTRLLDEEGNFKDLVNLKNSTSDVSCTAAQMPRLVGLAYASKLYRQNPELHQFTKFSNNGNEVAFGTIGDASTSEGLFFESMNAAGVLQIPMVVSIWDDAYGISVPKKFQTTKEDISVVLEGFRRTETEDGFDIYRVKGWDYEELCEAYRKAVQTARAYHVPALVHVYDLTQPQGHSSSGSHERYKSKERLEWEKEYDSIKKMREWILSNGICDTDELEEIENAALSTVKNAKNAAWTNYLNFMSTDHAKTLDILERLVSEFPDQNGLTSILEARKSVAFPVLSDNVKALKKAARSLKGSTHPLKNELLSALNFMEDEGKERFDTFQHSQSSSAALLVKEIKPTYSENSAWLDGREIVRANFISILEKDKRVFAIGEDVGDIGDVNQGFAGLQDMFGVLRVTDTGIRESTIIGQGIGAALRGLRPITEIQYLDYLIYTIQTLSDDLACLHYRTKGGQKAPLIIRTRGHRLEGVWHSGSPMSMILGTLRGIYLLVPRDMTQAAGFYNTMLKSDDPALIIECLNGYRLKEQLPDNIGEFTVPIGVPEILRNGTDITIVTYGTMCRIVMDAAEELTQHGISCEVIDVQSLMPFDIHHQIVESIKKTNRVIFADEDVPGGGSAYMLQQVIEKQNGFQWLDTSPRTLSAKDHRPAYATDGDYFSKPSTDDVFDLVYEIMEEADPNRFPTIN
jgi:transketolase